MIFVKLSAFKRLRGRKSVSGMSFIGIQKTKRKEKSERDVLHRVHEGQSKKKGKQGVLHPGYEGHSGKKRETRCPSSGL